MIVALGQPGYEKLLARELESAGASEHSTFKIQRSNRKKVGSADPADRCECGPLGQRALPEDSASAALREVPGALIVNEISLSDDSIDFVFSYLILCDATEVRGESVNALAQQLADYFMRSLEGEKVEAAWPCLFLGPHEIVGLGRRIGGVERTFQETLRKKLSRVAKLAVFETPRGTARARGLFVFFSDFGHAFAAREAWLGGQKRMADDAAAPSRSFLKVEEAYGVLGREPQPGETVCDLGAAPGGWSYSAAKRGARVVAVDNGPLKGGALGHPQIEHRREDAFKFSPQNGKNFDWLFCDMVEEPHHVLENIVRPWLARGWCRHFVVNLKFGRVDPIALLAELRAPNSPFAAHAENFRVRHLYHDREEFTVVGRASNRE